MNLTALNTQLTMSSREIAELTGKRHDAVMRDIRAMIEGLGTTPQNCGVIEGTYLNTQNKQQPCFHLDKEHTLCLVSGYNVTMRMFIVKRWKHLEEQKQAMSPMAIAATMNSAQLGLLLSETQAKEEAIRTKAQIGSKREATCMARVGQANRKVKELEHQLAERPVVVMRVDVSDGESLHDWARTRLQQLKGASVA